MIKALVGIVIRSLVELALVLFVIGALLLAVAGVIGQRIVTTNPNLVERAAERLAGVLAALARGARAAEGLVEPGDDEKEWEDDEEEEEPLDWRELVV